MNKYLAVILNEKSLWTDGERHTLEEWRKILEEHETVKSVSPFLMTEDNYEDVPND